MDLGASWKGLVPDGIPEQGYYDGILPLQLLGLEYTIHSGRTERRLLCNATEPN